VVAHKTKPILFGSLKSLMEQLGFQTQAVPDAHVAFRHAKSKALVVLTFYQDEQPVSPTDLAVARRVLDEFGVLGREEFDSALRERAVAG
jgi:hypothetical protein